ncbi:cytochrome P450 [Xylariomycetidae sp. FL2044]|nr:cytochrome P450 [Xylariomycetidae sp. FL2044]
MPAQLDVFLQQILAEGGAAVEISRACECLEYDIAGLLALGYALNLQTEETNRFIPRAVAHANSQLNVYMQCPVFRQRPIDYVWTRLGQFRAMKYRAVLDAMIGTRTSMPQDEKRDFCCYFTQVLDDGNQGFRGTELLSETLLFMTAGADSTASAMSALFFYLAHDQSCYTRLADQLRTTFRDGGKIKNRPKLTSCHYLRACIDEALRMSAPFSSTIWRTLVVDDTEPLVVDGVTIPKGTQSGVNTYSLHHNEDLFPEPFRFRPERWLSRASDGSDDQHNTRRVFNDGFMAFSAGSRACAGKPTAYNYGSKLCICQDPMVL